MSLQSTAEVRAKLTGADEVAQGAEKVASAWEGATRRLGGVGKQAAADITGAFSGAAQSMVTSLAGVVTASGRIDFASARANAIDLQRTVTGMAIASGRSVEEVDARFKSLGKAIQATPQEAAALAQAVTGVTYKAREAERGLEGMAGFGASTNQSAREMVPLQAALQTVGRVGEDTGRALGVITQQAKDLGTTGGPRALADSFVRLQGVFSATAADATKATALIGGFGGKGAPLAGRDEALGRFVADIENNPLGLDRVIGKGARDEFGRLKDPTAALQKVRDYYIKREGRETAERRFAYNYGPQAAALLFRTDFDAVRQAEHAGMSMAPTAALLDKAASAAGRRDAAQREIAAKAQEAVGPGSAIGAAADWYGGFSARHPWAGALGAGATGAATGAAWRAGSGVLRIGAGLARSGVQALAGGTGGGGAAAGGGGESLLAAGGGASAVAAGGVVVGGIIAQGKVLSELGAASAAKQGLEARPIYYTEAGEIAGRANRANLEAAAIRNPNGPEAKALAGLQAGEQAKFNAEAVGVLKQILAAVTNAPPPVIQNMTGGEITVSTGRGEQ